MTGTPTSSAFDAFVGEQGTSNPIMIAPVDEAYEISASEIGPTPDSKTDI